MRSSAFLSACSRSRLSRERANQPLRRNASRPGRIGRRGTTSLEFALTGALILTLLLGAVEASRYMITLSSLRMASAEAARAVTLLGSANMNAGHPPCTGLGGTLQGAAGRVRFLDAASLSATLSGCQTDTSGVTTVTVTLTYPFRFALDGFGPRDQSLSDTSGASFN